MPTAENRLLLCHGHHGTSSTNCHRATSAPGSILPPGVRDKLHSHVKAAVGLHPSVQRPAPPPQLRVYALEIPGQTVEGI